MSARHLRHRILLCVLLGAAADTHAGQAHRHHGPHPTPAPVTTTRETVPIHAPRRQQVTTAAADRSAPDEHAHHGHADAAAGHAGHPAPAAAPAPLPPPSAADLAAAFPALAPHAMQHAPVVNSLVLIDRLEAWDNAHGHGQTWAVDAWVGSDTDRLWLRSDGQREAGQLRAAGIEALYGHAVSPWWDVLVGIAHTHHRGAGNRTRAALGVQGLAPYKFDVGAMAYLGGPARVELQLEAGYDLLLSNRLILQPELHARLAAAADPDSGLGAGQASVEAGLRLRYEISRRFAPYVGVVHERTFGDTAALRRVAGQRLRESRWVAGIRLWF